MKLALVLMINDRDLPFLKLHLPIFKDSFDGICAIADPTEGTAAIDYLISLGASIHFDRWDYNWGRWATAVFNFAETKGYDAAMRMDADECLWADAGFHIRQKLAEEAALLVFPRHEFFADRYHVRPDLFPDFQARAWRLNRGIVVQGAKHEGVDFGAHDLIEATDDPEHCALRVWDEKCRIYHYGWSSKTAIWNAQVKYQRQAQVAMGQSPVVAFPPDQPIFNVPTAAFDRPQPLDPGVVGPFAPYNE